MLIMCLGIVGTAWAGSIGAQIKGDGAGNAVETMEVGDGVIKVSDTLSSTLTSPGSFRLSIKNQTQVISDGTSGVRIWDYSLAISGRTTGTGKVTAEASIAAGVSTDPNGTRGAAAQQSMVIAESGKAGTAEGSASTSGLAEAGYLYFCPFAYEEGDSIVTGSTSAYGKASGSKASVTSGAMMGSSFELGPERIASSDLLAEIVGSGLYQGSADANGSAKTFIVNPETLHQVLTVATGDVSAGGVNSLPAASFVAMAEMSSTATDSPAGTSTEVFLTNELRRTDQLNLWHINRNPRLVNSYELEARAITTGDLEATIGEVSPEGGMGTIIDTSYIDGIVATHLDSPIRVGLYDRSAATGILTDSSDQEGIQRYVYRTQNGKVIARYNAPPP